MWISKSDLMQLGYQKRTINHYISSGKWDSRETGETGSRGEAIREILISSLPADLQQRIRETDRARSVDPSAIQAPIPSATRKIQAPPSKTATEKIQSAQIIEFNENRPGATNSRSNVARPVVQAPFQPGAPDQSKRHQPGARETWISKKEIQDIGIAIQTLRRHIKSSKWESRLLPGGKNGKGVREILLESLPHDLQLKYWNLQKSKIDLDEVEDSGIGDVNEPALKQEEILVQALKRYAPEVREAFLNEAQRQAELVERYEAIEPKRVKDQNSRYQFVQEVIELCKETECTDERILAIEPSRSKSKSPHTLNNWLKEYKESGLAAFLRKPPTITNTIDKRKATVSAQAIEWINRVWRNYPSPRHLHKDLKKKAQSEGWAVPSESWIRRRYKALPKIVSSLTFKGEKAYTSKYSPFVPRDFRDLAALQVLCGDHSVRDLTVMLPDGQLTRPWLTVWLDLRTYLIWGWHLDLTPSSNTIGLAYVNGVKTFGAQPLSQPDNGFYSYLQTDQGKDYRSKTLTGQTLVFPKAARIEGGLNALCTQRKVGFMEELGLKHMMARGYNAKEKPVERIFRDISDWEQNHFENEYCGRDAKSRPDAWVRSWHRHERLLKKFDGNLEFLASESPFVALDDYREMLAARINEFNHEQHKRAVLGGSKIVPIQEYERLYTTRYEISENALALLLMKVDRRKIGKNGINMFQPHWSFLAEEMSEFKGEYAEVRWSDGDYSRIWAVLPNGSIVEAPLVTPGSIVNPNKKTMETIARQKANERKINREWNFIQQSNWRGETVEDRVAAQFAQPEGPDQEQQKMAVNAGPRIHNLTRFDKPKSVNKNPAITAESIEKTNIVEGMFRPANKTSKKIKEEWED